jgi:hypothetical protein
MTTWHCPSCRLELEAVAIACGHRCPARRSQWVDFEESPAETEEAS